MKILFFLESLQSGGKERRSVELVKYLKSQHADYDIEIVLTEEEIHYEEIYETDVKITILERKSIKYDPFLFLKFFNICRNFKPDLIHCFGKMTTFYAIPAKVYFGIPLISSLIADAKKSYSSLSPYSFLLNINVFFSDIVLSNSLAGLKAYNLTIDKARVIHNGVHLSRFQNIYDPEAIRKELKIKTQFIIVMVAGFSTFKDYDLFVEVAGQIEKLRSDVTFLGVGDGTELKRIKQIIEDKAIGNIILTGKRKDIEKIVAASDIGLLCTKSEGISNSIIEYMALGKPVIATDITGGSRELISEGKTGFCTQRNSGTIVGLINKLLDDPELRRNLGKNGKERIENSFSISRMGKEFENLYDEVIAVGKESVVKKTAL
jgi:glycosyltransferase involved in cell wall biosynthesis